jgi:hypothetical protein
MDQVHSAQANKEPDLEALFKQGESWDVS